MSTAKLWAELEDRLLPVFAGYRRHIAELPIEVKADRTLLTEADVEVQDIVIESIRSAEPEAVIIAEEDGRVETRQDVASAGGRVWVVDPIDGTAQFVRGEGNEFCSVVCLLEDWIPVAAFVLAPEFGTGRTPLVISVDARSAEVMLNGRVADRAVAGSSSKWISATRSSGTAALAFDGIAEGAGFQTKTRSTSQTLDMVRTAIDLSGATTPSQPSFDMFWRRRQKVWDGFAGLCLGATCGLRICDEDGNPLPSGPTWLSAAEPAFPSTVMGQPDVISWFLDVAHS